MICWAITGPVGAGKSSFSKALVSMGAALVNADALGHEVLENKDVIKEVTGAFGGHILERGMINRPRLGELVFNDGDALDKLNSITHPHICSLATLKINKLALENRHPLAVFEAAVYFLLPEPPVCNLVIAVMADSQTRSQRLVESRGLSQVEILARLNSQISLEKHWETADVLVHNDGTMEDLTNIARSLMLEHGLIAGGDDPRRELSS
jgi:dephospho-CoA kinase